MSAIPASGAKRVKKQVYFARLKELVHSTTRLFIVHADNVRSKQFAQIRYALRGKATILMGKNTMIKTCIRSILSEVPVYEKFLPLVAGNIGIVFCHEDPKEIKKIIAQYKVPAPARQGAIAPCDVFVPPGGTGMDPGQTSFFQSLGIATKIVKGQVEISNEVHIITKGSKVTASQATLLSKLNIQPFTYGLECLTVFDDGETYPADALDISEEDIRSYLLNAISQTASLALGSGLPSETSVAYSVMNAFRKSVESPGPITVRVNRLKTSRKELAVKVIRRGMDVYELADWSKTGLLVKASNVPVGATLEYLTGHYMLMSASSFLPVLALAPRENEVVLDMAAAPGGKSAFLAEMMKNTGALVANDLKKDRLPALASNLHRLGVRNALVTNLDARTFPKYYKSCFDRVLLDAPCSGIGVLRKSPEAKQKRKPEDFQKLAALQRELILAAIDLLHAAKDKGYLVYSTCSLSVEENEMIVQHALKHRAVKLVELPFTFGTPGFKEYQGKKFHESMALCRRIYPHVNNMDGFFVAKLKKLSDQKANEHEHMRLSRTNYQNRNLE
uniref:25S rRNA (Cytosine-C(5))-methyltransferase nop2-like n=1 Tax=Dermatophagoides pteronyssinus TaxID=6956 RepID=A0A6P6XYD4_DERPT|nr:25S rRNA (cytosine-C(5))-methyltransferase nop2-like [Dermatophagoides pteronyssinus]